MNKRFSTACAAVVLAGTASSASAAMTIDIRLVNLGGVAITGSQQKFYVPTPADAGKVASFEVFAEISGTDGTSTNEGFGSAAGAYRSTNIGAPAFLGDFSNVVVVPPHDGPGSGAGSLQDLDGDGDLDAGASGNVSLGWVYADPAGTLAGASFKIITFDITLSTIGVGETDVDFVKRLGNTNGGWREDGVARNYGSTVIVSPAVFANPEPSGLATLALVAPAILGRRRRATR